MTSAACEVVPWFRFSPVFVCAVIICMFCVLATPTLVAPGAGLSPGRTLRGFAGLSAASGGTCRALPYIEPDGMVSAEDYRISDPFNQTEHCTYEFRDVCLRPATATESGANVAGGGEELAFVIETGGGCDMTGWRYPCGELRTGPGLGKNFEVVRGDLTGAEFDPVPTLLFDRRASGGDDNFWHGMITGVYHLYLSLRVSGLSSYDGRRIAYVNGDSPPTLQALGDVYKAYGPHVEWADYTTIPDRRCFRSLSVMRTGWTLRYPNFDTMNEDPTTLDFADYIAEGLGLSGGRAALPPVPRVYYLHRGNSHRRIANYRELLGAMPKRVEVTTHNVSAMSFRDQVAALRNSSIILGMHGAAHMLNLWLPRGGGVLEIWHYGMDEEAPVMFRNAAIASGKFYNYLSVRDPAAVHIENRTDFAPHWQFHEAEIEVDVRSFAEHFDAVLQAVEVLQRRPLN